MDTMSMYAFQVTDDSADEPDWKSAYEDELKKAASASLRRDKDALSEVAAFTAQLKQFYENNKWDKRQNNADKDGDSNHKWKLKPPKDGESTSKMVLTDGKRKKYNWCEYHKQWTIHSSPKECRKQPTGKDSSDEDSNPSNSESDSNTSSIDGRYYSDEEGSDSS